MSETGSSDRATSFPPMVAESGSTPRSHLQPRSQSPQLRHALPRHSPSGISSSENSPRCLTTPLVSKTHSPLLPFLFSLSQFQKWMAAVPPAGFSRPFLGRCLEFPQV
jgi:hypothetical protein